MYNRREERGGERGEGRGKGGRGRGEGGRGRERERERERERIVYNFFKQLQPNNGQRVALPGVTILD